MLITVLVPLNHHPVPEWIKILDRRKIALCSADKGYYANGIGYWLDGEPEAIKDWLEPMEWVYRQDSNCTYNKLDWNKF